MYGELMRLKKGAVTNENNGLEGNPEDKKK